MNRGIKFRAWDKKKKKMFYRTLGEMAQDGWIPGEEWGEYFSEPMQYIGLKDRNEKEIYAGDIVKNESAIETVVYIADQLIGAYVAPFGDEEHDFSPKYCKVIGNVWENPELLGVANE